MKTFPMTTETTPTPAEVAGQHTETVSGVQATVEVPVQIARTTYTDAAKRTFDPAKHAAKPDGSPRLDRNGKFYSVNFGKRQIPAAARPAPVAAPVATAQPPAAPEPAPKFDDIERAATGASSDAMPAETSGSSGASTPSVETCLGVIQTALVLIGSEEGILSEQEKILLRLPLKRVLDKYDIGASVLPVEIDLAFAVASLLIVRLQKPKTATWFAKAKAWAVNRWFGWKGTRLANEVREGVAST